MKQNDLIVVENPDKEFLTNDTCAYMPASGSKIICAGRSGSGKGCLVKNIIARANPPFERIVCLHLDTKTEEWKDCDAEMVDIDNIPENDSWDRTKKNCLIIDEFDFEGATKAQKGKIDRIMCYTASHYNVCVFLLQQNFTSINPPSIRRSADFWVIWPSVDYQSMIDVSRKTGHSMKQLAKQFCKTKFDSICFDFTGSKYPLRLNFFTPIHDAGSDSEDE